MKLSVVLRDIESIKLKLKQQWKNKGGYENYGQKEVRALEDKYSNAKWSQDENDEAIMKAIRQFDEWCMNYTGGVNENKLFEHFKKFLNESMAGKELICVTPGRVEIIQGSDARSADVKEGDIFTVVEEKGGRYWGSLDIQGYRFQKNAGLSGHRNVDTKLYGSSGIIFGVMKRYVDNEEDDFWATWKTK
jgi:hypothetical protein